jgi:hypothetical protein
MQLLKLGVSSLSELSGHANGNKQRRGVWQRVNRKQKEECSSNGSREIVSGRYLEPCYTQSAESAKPHQAHAVTCHTCAALIDLGHWSGDSLEPHPVHIVATDVTQRLTLSPLTAAMRRQKHQPEPQPYNG